MKSSRLASRLETLEAVTSDLSLRGSLFLPLLSRRLHNRSSASRRSALAYVELLVRRIFSPLVLIVVRKLDAGLNVPPGINPDPAVLDYRLTVRVA